MRFGEKSKIDTVEQMLKQFEEASWTRLLLGPIDKIHCKLRQKSNEKIDN